MIWIILILGFLLRLISINQSFWLDEATSATLARNFSFYDIIHKFSPGDFHPPLYYLSLKAWTIPFGVSEVSTRLLSILFGLGTVYLVYLLVLQIINHERRTIGLVTSLLLATSPLHIYYSQEARMYAMETFLVSLGILAFVKTMGKGRVGWWIAFALSLAAIGLTDYLPLLIIPVFWIYGLASKQKVSWWTKFFTSHIILVVAAFWWFPIFSKQFLSGISVAASLPGWWNILGKSSFKEILLVPVKFTIGRIGFDNKWLYGLIMTIVGLLFGYLIFKSAKLIRKNKNIQLVTLWLIFPTAIAAAIGFRISVFSYFRLLFVLPAFYILVAYGLSKVKESVFPILLFAVFGANIIFSSIYLLNTKFQREDWRRLASELGVKDGAIAVFPAKSQREAFLYYGGKDKIVESENLNKDYKEIWLMRYVQEITDPKDEVRLKIESLGYNKTSEENFNGVLVWKYENKSKLK